MSTKIIAEIGINHNGNLGKACEMIKIAAIAGCDYAKFQKRNPDVCVPEQQKLKLKKVPWSKKSITYLQYKNDVEFGVQDWAVLFHVAQQEGIEIFASVWDLDSVKFMARFTDIVKIPSAQLTNEELLWACRDKFETRILSTGMSVEDEIVKAIRILEPHVIMHTNSVYPTPVDELNLGYLLWLQKRWPDHQIGYSSHYYGIRDIPYAVALGATWVEKHITLNHNDWGSDQSASVEPHGLFQMVKEVRDFEETQFQGNEPRKLFPGEEVKRDSLREVK